MQNLSLILKANLWCLITVIVLSVWANYATAQGYNLAMSNLTGTIQDIPAGEAACWHYQVKNTGEGADDIYLYSEVVSSTDGLWTISLVPSATSSITLSSPQQLSADQTLSFYLKAIPPPDAILGSCTIRITAVNSYFYEHAAGDGWPVGGDADVQQDVVSMRLIPPTLTITSTTPSEGGLVLASTGIEAVFNLDPARWNPVMSLQDDSSGVNVAGRVSLQGSKLSFVPDTPLLPSRQYHAVVSGSGFVHEWRFATMAEEYRIKQVNKIEDIVNYSNPFNMTTDSYTAFSQLAIGSADVVIEIYTLDGTLVQTLTYQNGTCLWDGRNNNGDKVSSGMYIYVVKMKAAKKMGRMTVIR